MKKLTAADYALLAKRGKVVNGFNTQVDSTVKTSADRFSHLEGFKKVKKTKKAKKSANPNANHPLVGRMLHTSWGYNMTINEFCKILEVSPTGKTVKCRMLTKEGFNGFTGTVEAGEKMVGPEFRLKIDGGDYFHGSYPYIVRDTKEESSFHMGYFGIYNGGKVYENHMD
jgi:hypothetical protein